MVEKQKVLFLCTGNSCRSQMAEGFLRDMAGNRFEVYSAGLTPSSVNPLAIKAMDGVGVNISSHTSDSLDKYLDQNFHHLITVCDHAKESCPIFPGAGEDHHWGFDDPAEAEGTEPERFTVFCRVRDEIQQRIHQWLKTLDPPVHSHQKKIGETMSPRFLAIGHFCYDVAPDGYVLGGGAAYSTITARNLGCRACAVTAVGSNFDRQQPILDGIDVSYHESPETTIFDNRYDSDGQRQQLILGVGGGLGAHHIPPQWKDADIAYLCPLTGEVDSPVAQCFNHALVGVTPQGWMRAWDESRRVRPKRWQTAEAILPHADVLVLSEEDIAASPEDLEKYIQWTRIVVLTKGRHGATLYENGQILESTAYPADEVDPTGAGDVFAAAFLIKYHETGSPQAALNFAHCTASFAVEGRGTTSIPTLDQVSARLRKT